MSTALRRALGRVRPPRVSVVVVVQGGSALRCLETLPAAGARLEILLACRPDDADARRVVDEAARRHPRVRRAPADPSWLDAAVDSARGDYLGFAAADDVVPATAYDALVAALDSSGSDLALGVHVDVRGDRRRRVPWASEVLQDALGVALADRPGLVLDVAPTGKLFRLDRWRSAGVSLPSWERAPAAVARLMTGAQGVDVLSQVVHERHDRQTSLPVQEQDRFRAEVLAERWAAWTEVESVLADQPAPVREAWLLGLVEHCLPPLYVDAVGGGPSYAAVLTARTAALLVRMTPDVLRRVSLPARLGAWAATHGSLDDIALVQDHLADHPHGLPTEPAGVLAALPDGLSSTPSARWRQVADVDRRLHSRVRLGAAGPGLVELRGAAFVAYVPGDELPVVRIGDRPVQLERHATPDLELWAARAHEDRSGCGFSATLAPAELDGSEPWTVSVLAGGQTHRHVVHPPSDHAAAADVLLSGLRLDGDELLAEVLPVAGCRVRLTGAQARVEAVPDAAALRMPLTVPQWGERGQIPAGRYALEAWREDRARSTLEVAELVHGPVEVVGERVRLEVRRSATGPRVVVGSPPGLPDRSARGQQRLLDGVYRAGRGTPGSPTVLLETFRGRSAGDNPGAVGRALQSSERARAAGLDLAVVVDDPSVVAPAGIRAVPRRTRAWYDALARAELYVANAGAPYWFQKAPGQMHVQTWHGTPLKRIGEDRGPGDFATWRHRRRIADQARSWDAMVSPSRYVTDIYRSAFGYAGTVLEVGYPRNDVLLAPDADVLRERVRARLGVAPQDRVVLYAPTWRQYVGVRDSKPLHLDAEAVVRAMPDAVVLVRGHYNSTSDDDVFRAHPRIHDVTRYPDVADLFLAADALVTDYSSVMFDFVLTDRPVVLLVPDLEQYRDVERGFYFDIEARSPGPLVTTTADVVDVLSAPDAAGDRRADFRSVFCPFEDGAASARVVEYCLDRLSATSSSASSTERSP